MKSVETRIFFWSVFSSVRTEYEDLLRNTKIYDLDIDLRFCIIIYSFVCQYSVHYYSYCCNQKQSSGAVLQKKVFFQISKNSQENNKKEIPGQMFSCEFCEISHNIFFKECFGRLLQHKHSLCLLSHLKSDVTHICRLNILSV